MKTIIISHFPIASSFHFVFSETERRKEKGKSGTAHPTRANRTHESTKFRDQIDQTTINWMDQNTSLNSFLPPMFVCAEIFGM
jgi:hypothetical protein